jgi:hypothetical protein
MEEIFLAAHSRTGDLRRILTSRQDTASNEIGLLRFAVKWLWLITKSSKATTIDECIEVFGSNQELMGRPPGLANSREIYPTGC